MTGYDREVTVDCAFCYADIYPSQKGIADLMGEYAHKKCVAENCDKLCPQCGTLFEQETERCEFCLVRLNQITHQEARKIAYRRHHK